MIRGTGQLVHPCQAGLDCRLSRMGEMSGLGWIVAIKVMLIVCAIGRNADSTPSNSRYKWTTVVPG